MMTDICNLLHINFHVLGAVLSEYDEYQAICLIWFTLVCTHLIATPQRTETKGSKSVRQDSCGLLYSACQLLYCS